LDPGDSTGLGYVHQLFVAKYNPNVNLATTTKSKEKNSVDSYNFLIYLFMLGLVAKKQKLIN
jgi:hypothetical protein